MKKLTLIIAVLGMLAMNATAFAGGSATPLSDQQLDMITGGHSEYDDDDYDNDYGSNGFGPLFNVEMGSASGVVLIGMAVNSSIAVQINMAIINGGNYGSITGSNSVNP